MEDSIPEEYSSPDTPVAPVPDQLVAPEDTEQPTPTLDNPLPVGLDDPLDLVLNTNSPLSEQLRDLRRETQG